MGITRGFSSHYITVMRKRERDTDGRDVVSYVTGRQSAAAGAVTAHDVTPRPPDVGYSELDHVTSVHIVRVGTLNARIFYRSR